VKATDEGVIASNLQQVAGPDAQTYNWRKAHVNAFWKDRDPASAGVLKHPNVGKRALKRKY
jgi:hypothetical protein